MKVVAVGECTVDRHLDRGVETVGGISLNFAINCRRIGASEVALVSSVGLDDGAERVRAKLALDAVDTSRLREAPGVTATQEIRLGPGGERIFPPGGYHPGVLADLHLSAADREFIGGFDLVAVPYFRQLEHLFWPAMTAARPGAKRVVDLLDGADLGADFAGIAPIVATADLVFLSAVPEVVESLLHWARGAQAVIVVTHGAAGSTGLVAGQRVAVPAVPVPAAEVVDTTGCGDAFQAAFAIEYFQSGELARALRAGATRAASVIGHVGATGG
ncbi:MAG: PfkB family carbohydrate kinase [Gemmatimonadales bacterium]